MFYSFEVINMSLTYVVFKIIMSTIDKTGFKTLITKLAINCVLTITNKLKLISNR